MFAADQLEERRCERGRRKRSSEDFGQIFLFLRVAPIANELVDAQVRVGAVTQGDASAGSREFLHGDTMFGVMQTETPVFH